MRPASLAAMMALNLTVSGVLPASPLVDFPVENHALATGNPEAFYMYVDRTFEGKKSSPWQAGQFGYVRNPRRDANGEIVFTRLHEGIDIRPLRRDAKGNPLDPILAAAPGRIVHVNDQPGASNYGRYVVIEHLWDGCRYYTLYAHLARTVWRDQGEECLKNAFLGNAQRLPGGNTRVTFSASGRIEEVDAAGEMAMQFSTGIGAAFGFATWSRSMVAGSGEEQ